jgi:hypothetical protein
MKLAPLLFACAVSLAQDNYKPLFNEKNLDEWNIDTPGLWEVRGGSIVGTSPGLKYNDFLRTKKHYSDFILRLWFRMKDGEGNSGIQFRSRPVTGSHEVSGYQADIGQTYWGCLYDESRRKRVLVAPAPHLLASLDKAGWNEYVITARGKHITLDLNGIRTVDYREPDEGIDMTGFIALQIHSGPPMQIEFKNLRILDLGPPSTR